MEDSPDPPRPLARNPEVPRNGPTNPAPLTSEQVPIDPDDPVSAPPVDTDSPQSHALGFPDDGLATNSLQDDPTPEDQQRNNADGDLSGWSLQYESSFSTLDHWVARVETQDNDNSRNIEENVVPSADGLTIHARREAGYNRPYTSGEIHGTGPTVVPNYFRAEVVAQVMDERGLWPAALWFRPVDHPDGEIDVMEYMGGRVENDHRPRFAVTMHNEYGPNQAALKNPLHIDQMTNNTITGVHTYTIEKTPGQIKVWIDGDEENASIFMADEAAWWDRIMEVEGREWYPRITLQVGSGSRRQVVPEPERTWQHSEMHIYSLRLWSMD